MLRGQCKLTGYAKRIDRAGKADEVYLVGARVPTRERCSEEEGDGAEQERWRLGLPMKPATN